MSTSKVSDPVLSLLCIEIIQSLHRFNRYNTLFEWNYHNNRLAHDMMASYIDNLGEAFINAPCTYCAPHALGDK